MTLPAQSPRSGDLEREGRDAVRALNDRSAADESPSLVSGGVRDGDAPTPDAEHPRIGLAVVGARPEPVARLQLETIGPDSL